MYRDKKIVAMIPARLGSQRIKLKNLRYLGDKLLSQWVAEACKDTGIFDGIYINSDADIFEEIAVDSNINFYKRPTYLANNDATNDGFGLDFINNIDCDILVQVNPTSPFTKAQDIVGVVDLFLDNSYKTVHTVKKEQIEGLFIRQPLNFDPTKQMPPSQELEPIYLFTSSIMAWDTATFKVNMKNYGCAVYGGPQSIGYYVIEGEGAIDIDNEKDFFLAEMIINRRNSTIDKGRYYDI
jgi:CMP-N,N'-diacetyllegionaminic acid synthase